MENRLCPHWNTSPASVHNVEMLIVTSISYDYLTSHWQARFLSWYINLPPNSIQSCEELVEKFHEQFYRPGMEMSFFSLARMAQASDESPIDYLTRFKLARNWCRVPRPEVEFVKLALNGLDVEYKKKFLGANFCDMYELAQHVEQYDYLLREEKASKSPSRGTIYKNPTVSYASAEPEEYAIIDAAEIVIDKPYICKALTHVNPKDTKVRSTSEETVVKTSKAYTFDITKADAIFDQLLLAKIINFGQGTTFPKPKIWMEGHIASIIIRTNTWQTTASCFGMPSKVWSTMENFNFQRRKWALTLTLSLWRPWAW